MNYNPTSGELTYYPIVNYLIQNTNSALSNLTTAQVAFNSPFSTFNAQVGTYSVEWVWSCSAMSAVSRTLSVIWQGGATYNLVRMYYNGSFNATLATTATDDSVYQTATTAVVVGSASTSATARFIGKGIIRISGAGTIIPRVIFSASPGASSIRTSGSYIVFKYLNNDNANSFGDWV
jgi:hypothetical protein